jgi:outer membrane protein assembly factor BamA
MRSFVGAVFTFLILFTSNVKGQLVVQQQSDSIQQKFIANIIILGAKRTRDEVILRELTFQTGDTVFNIDKEIQRSRSNLINTLLFNFVDIKKIAVDSFFTDITIVLKERWYIWPLPVFKFAEPNFNTWWLNKSFARTNYGIMLVWKNFRGWNEDLAFKAQFGYSKEFQLLYRMPYLTMRQRMGMQLSANYIEQEEITVGTDQNKRIFFRSNSGKTRIELGGRASLFYRRKLYVTHTLNFSYQNLQVVDSLTRFTNDYFYQNKAHTEFPGFSYVFRYDKRDNKGYPLKGALVQAEITKYGFSFDNSKGMNVSTLQAYSRNFFKLGYRWFAATQVKGKINLSKEIPYYLQQGLGYENFIRGYEYYIVDGQHFALFKSNIKYNFIKPNTFPVDILKRTGFYMFHYAAYINAFFDAGYVLDKYYENQNPLSNNMLYGGGLGLDFVSYYDRVIRFEFSMNKAKEYGFFVHFVQPI